MLAIALTAAVVFASSGPSEAAHPVPAAWLWPLEGPRALVRPYLAPAHPYGPGHRGIDLGASESVDVRAPAAGVVHFSGFVVDRWVISIRHPGGTISSYEPVRSELHAGDRVARGETIGRLQPGHCMSPCLHLGVRRDGAYLSPLNYLGGIPRSVLLPTRRLP